MTKSGTSKGEPLKWINEVALLHSGDECLTWPFWKGEYGYGKVLVNGKTVRAHRYVCELVNGPPPTPKHQAAHSCGKGHLACIAPEHLSWKTNAENCADKFIHGTNNGARGEQSGKAKLTEAEVRQILALKGKEKQVDLAERFAVSPSLICHIHAGRTWAWLFEEREAA